LGPLISSDEVKAVWLAETRNLKRKTISTPRKINAVLLNININSLKLVRMCGYKLAINWQNLTEIYLIWVKLLQKVLGEGGLLFDSQYTCMLRLYVRNYYLIIIMIINLRECTYFFYIFLYFDFSNACLLCRFLRCLMCLYYCAISLLWYVVYDNFRQPGIFRPVTWKGNRLTDSLFFYGLL